MCTLGLLAFNLSQKVRNDFLKVYTWFAFFQLESEGCQLFSKGVHLVCSLSTCTLGLLAFKWSQKVANDFLKVYSWFACFQLESEGWQ